MQLTKVATAIHGSKGGGGEQHTPTESPDTLHSTAIAKILLALGEGEFDDIKPEELYKLIYLDGTVVENSDGSRNFSDVYAEFRPGTQTQSSIRGMAAVENEETINVALKYGEGAAWVRSFRNLDLDACRIRIGFPTLMLQEDDGDRVGSTVNYRIDLRTDGGAWQTVRPFACIGKTTSLYERDHRIDFPKGANVGWDVRVVRLTADSTSTSLLNATNIEAVTTIIDGHFTYPFTALLYVEFNAKSFQNIPKVSILAKGRKIRVPTNYDPVNHTYSGDWDGTFKLAWSRNPAWIYYDIAMESRFMLGDRVDSTMLSKWELYPIAQRCDQLVPDGKGGMEPRFLCDVYIQSRAQAWTLFNDIAAIFGGIQFWGNGRINLVPDAPSDVKQVITRANVIDGVIQYGGGSKRNRYTAAVVGYSNPGNHYADDAVPVSSNKLLQRYQEYNATEVTAIGCTRESEAQRRGNNLILTNQDDNTTTFRLGLEGIRFTPGDVFAVADDTISGLAVGGRIMGVTSRTEITLDRVPQAQAGDAILTMTSGGNTERRIVAEINGTKIRLEQNDAFEFDAVEGAVWVMDVDAIDLQYFRAITITWEEDSNSFAVSGVVYQPNKYDAVDKGARYDTGKPISVIDYAGQKSPGKPVITSFERTVQSKRVTTLRIDWEAAQGAVAYEVQWRRDSNNYVNVPRQATTSYEVDDVYSGIYYARVRAIGPGDSSSPWVDADVATIVGREGKPAAPLGLTATTDGLWTITLSWGFDLDTDDTNYTRIQYGKTKDDSSMQELTYVPYPGKNYQMSGLQPATVFWFRAKLVDRLGNESDWSDWASGSTNADGSEYLKVIGGDYLTAEDGKALQQSMVGAFEASLINAMANNDQIDHVYKVVGTTVRADILQVKTLVADLDKSMAQLSTDLKAEMGETQALVSNKLTAMIDSDGTTAMQTLRVGAIIDKQEYLAGMTLSVIAKAGQQTITRVGFNADQFVITTGQGDAAFTPFAIKNNIVYLDTAMIGEGTITDLMIGNYIQTTGFGQVGGWQLNKVTRQFVVTDDNNKRRFIAGKLN